MEGDLMSCEIPSQHGNKWCLSTCNDKTETQLCFACCMLNLESDQQLSLRKRIILSSFRDILKLNPQVVTDVIANDNEIEFRMTHLFLSKLQFIARVHACHLLCFHIHILK